MAVYAIGDIQGCIDELKRLLEKIAFVPGQDRLWFTGDLVNRGPGSLEVLRYVSALGDDAVVVLGNHDLHLLAVAAGKARTSRRDTLDEVLQAADRDELLHWLRHRPILHYDPVLDWLLIHAGLPPQWDVAAARACAAEVEATLRSDEHGDLLRQMYGDGPTRWDASLGGVKRLRFIINCLTRLRYCGADGKLALGPKGPPDSAPAGVVPWFRAPGRASAGSRIVFGHWSTLGCVNDPGILALDSGCVWGGQLTAARLGPVPAISAIDCRQAVVPR